MTATVVTLPAEHNGGQWQDDKLNAATVVIARGDHGSNGEVLVERFPLQSIHSTQAFRSSRTTGGVMGGLMVESHQSFIDRAERLRTWLGTFSSSTMPIIALVSHGGILRNIRGRIRTQTLMVNFGTASFAALMWTWQKLCAADARATLTGVSNRGCCR